MTEPAKDEAELLCALVDAIWDHLMPETRWTAKPYVERDLRAAILAAGWTVVPVTEQDALRAENARLREALSWYVRHGVWPVELVRDAGDTARAALAGEVKP